METTILYFQRSISKHVTDKEIEDIRSLIKKYRDLYYKKKITTLNNLQFNRHRSSPFLKRHALSSVASLNVEFLKFLFLFLRKRQLFRRFHLDVLDILKYCSYQVAFNFEKSKRSQKARSGE